MTTTAANRLITQTNKLLAKGGGKQKCLKGAHTAFSLYMIVTELAPRFPISAPTKKKAQQTLKRFRASCKKYASSK